MLVADILFVRAPMGARRTSCNEPRAWLSERPERLFRFVIEGTESTTPFYNRLETRMSLMMGVREYARHRQVSHPAVLKAIRAGRIHQTPDGRIDAEAADRDWARNTHPHPRAPRVAAAAGVGDFGFSRARAVREHYEALLARAEYEERAAKLLNADEVRVVSYRIDQAFREHMLQVPGAVIMRLQAHVREHGSAPTEHEVHLILSGAIRDALEAFADGIVAGAL